MYAYVDRSVAELSDGGRFLLHVMRGWLQAASKGHCPPGALAPLFARRCVLPALPAIHRFMADLNVHARAKISFHPFCAATIGDDEAVLLQLWHDARADPPHAQRTLALLLDTDAAGAAFDALLTASARLGEAGMEEVAIGAGAMPGAA